MYLKSLQVVGFKSFADKTTLNFHRGVTAIVGPNGCGKSNVLDSIRWVLGEQSAKALRGGEMRDVIFSGTDTRSALGMAEVSLTFGECEAELGTEFHEVTLTRRVFRDGASEYEINGTGCRLRDIQELFMDTGVGRSAYSIMEQGKIDLILSSRPEDRRAIFEEAAGITKYKSQKREALRKLESTEANLLRLADVVREVKRQVGSLQRQAAKARRFKEAQIELSGLEQRLARYQFNTYTSTIARLEAIVGTARVKHEQVTGRLETEEKRLEESRAELNALEADVNRLRDDEAGLKQVVDRAQAKAISSRNRVEEFTKMADQAQQEVDSTAEKIVAGREHLAELTRQVEESRGKVEAMKKELEAAQGAQLDAMRKVNACRGEVSQAEQHKLTQERLIQRQEQESAGLSAQMAGFQERFAALKLDETGLLKRVEEATAQLAATVEKVKREEELLREKRTGLQQATQGQREAEEALRTAERNRNEVNRAQQALQARRDALAQLQKQNVDAPQATQRLLKSGAGEMMGTLAQYVSVKPGYERPLAVLLGDAFQALLLKDSAQVDEWRKRLNRNEQCVFAPIELARPPGDASEGENARATSFMSCDAKVAGLVNALLEEAYVVDDLAAAWALKAKLPIATVVTAQGELITRCGVLCVGQDNGAALAVLHRQAELRGLETEIEKANANTSAAQLNVERAQETVKERQASVVKLQNEAQAHEVALATLRQEERNLRAGQEQLNRQKDVTGREVARLTAQERENAEKAERLRVAMDEAKRLQLEASEKLTALQARLTELQAEDQRQQGVVTTARLELAGLTHQCEAFVGQRDPVARRVQEFVELNKRRTQELAEHRERVEKAQVEITESERTAENKAVFLATVTGLFATAREKRADAIQRILTMESALKGLRVEQGNLQQSRSGDEVALAEQRLQLTNVRERVQRDYQTELEELTPLTEEDAGTDWTKVEVTAREKRVALDAMGPVNLDSIAEYDELEERLKFLTAQEADLVRSRDQLLQAIKEINATTQKLFVETFVLVKKNFQEMFVELFGGGKADLTLLDENDPLECGIEITAKPPGKQPQSVTLLSGGEKTMTAVALLFSIYMVKPSPFCVLDEMDAPLDESNINRFIKMLQRFVSQSQFVVITHNKRTISIADVLYGVTMEDRGVSRFVSMRLSKGEPVDAEAVAGVNRDDGVPSLAEAVSRN